MHMWSLVIQPTALAHRRSVPDECPHEVREIILACLEPDPAARPTAVQLVELLQRAPGVPPAKSAPTEPRWACSGQWGLGTGLISSVFCVYSLGAAQPALAACESQQ